MSQPLGKWILPTQVDGLLPGPRGGMACVAIGSKILVFGGSDRQPLTYDDLWVLDTADGTFEWTRISPSFAPGCKMMPRSAATLTAIGDKVYLFGGQEPLSELRFSDLKCLDISQWTWSEVEVKAEPPPRHSHAAGCLAERCLVIYGGSHYHGPLSDVWVFNPEQGAWSQPTITGEAPAAREMHSGCMVDTHTMLVYGGRASDGRILCDAALLDCRDMKWVSVEPTPFTRCAHSTVAMDIPPGLSLGDDGTEASTSGRGVLVYGGFSGESVEGDVFRLDSKSLEVELMRRGPREADRLGTVPQPRFAHCAAVVPWACEGGQAMLVFGGVNPAEDLNDIAVFVLGRQPLEESEGQAAGERVVPAIEPVALPF